MRTDRTMEVCNLVFLDFAQRPRNFDDGTQLAHMDEAVAIGSRHLGVDLRKYTMRTLGRCERRIHTYAKATIPVRIRRRYLNERYVDRHLSALKQRLDLAQKNRSVIGAAFANSLADIAA